MADTLVATHPLEAHRAAFTALTDELAAAGVDLAVGLEPLTTAVDLRVDHTAVDAAALRDAVGGTLPTLPEHLDRARRRPGDLARVRTSGSSPGTGPPGRGRRRSARSSTPTGARSSTSPTSAPGSACTAPAPASCSRWAARWTCARRRSRPGPPPRRCSARAASCSSRRSDGFRLAVRTSFAGYVADWLLDAATEFRPIEIRPTDQQRAEA